MLDAIHLLSAVLADACKGRPDAPIAALARGRHTIAVRPGAPQTGRMGICSRLTTDDHPSQAELSTRDATLKELAAELLTGDPTLDGTCFGMAAINALLPPPEAAEAAKAQDIIAERGQGKRVAVVGHFPFVERLQNGFAALDVLELSPHPGDRHASEAPEVLPHADVLALTGQTLTNASLPELLRLRKPGAFVMLVGPSTPFAPCLFDVGVDALCGSVVLSPDAALASILAGEPYRSMRGVESRIWLK